VKYKDPGHAEIQDLGLCIARVAGISEDDIDSNDGSDCLGGEFPIVREYHGIPDTSGFFIASLDDITGV